jgi:hypothetical protein
MNSVGALKMCSSFSDILVYNIDITIIFIIIRLKGGVV